MTCLIIIIFSKFCVNDYFYFKGFVSACVLHPFQTFTTDLYTRYGLNSRLPYNFFHYGINHIIGHPIYNTGLAPSNFGVNHINFCPFGTKFDSKFGICKYEKSLPKWIEKNLINSVQPAPKDQGCIYQIDHYDLSISRPVFLRKSDYSFGFQILSQL